MIHSFLTGFFLGLSLIIAIGAQNTFVLRQGIIGKHIFYVALFCAVSDTFLITLGVVGISFFFNSFINEYKNLLFIFSAIWVFLYGSIRLHSAIKSDIAFTISTTKSKDLFSTISIIALLTFANPHVYLDTMVLIGSVSQQFSGIYRITFAIGASIASFVFFFALGFGARILVPIMKKPLSWRILDGFIALVMFLISLNLAFQTSWL